MAVLASSRRGGPRVGGAGRRRHPISNPNPHAAAESPSGPLSTLNNASPCSAEMLRGRSLAVAVGSGGLLCGCCAIAARRSVVCGLPRAARAGQPKSATTQADPPSPVPPTAAGAVHVLVTLPEGVQEGQKLQVRVSDGRAVLITVPRGATAGTQLQVKVPASTPSTAQPPAPATGASEGGPGGAMSPLVCAKAHPSLTTWENGDVERTHDSGPPWRAARCSDVIPAEGRHFAQFTVKRQLIAMHFGIVRPSWNMAGGKDPHNVHDHVFFDAIDGRRWPNTYEQAWEGQQGAKAGDSIGLLLNRGEGSLSVYKNNERLGVMVAAGLSGEYCWAVSLYNKDDRVRVEALEAPALQEEQNELD